jgi:hypothetical protein
MGAVNIQNAIAEYHLTMAQMGMEMHTFHAEWHNANRDPLPPPAPDANWGLAFEFGNDFLQMHHEMVKATNDEPKSIMHHESCVSWFQSKNYELPGEWNPLMPIPLELQFNTIDPSLKRASNNPQFSLPKYFTKEGISIGEAAEPITGAKRLSDFININQLGCCIIYPHNSWHVAIGGAMNFLETAIDDPVFYFGVHWHIDKVFDDYKSLPRPFTVDSVIKKRELPTSFTERQLEQLKTAEELGLKAFKD